MKRLLFLSAIALLSASSCKKCEDTTPATTKLKYAQTQCADAWGASDSDTGTIRLVRQYLYGKGLATTDIYIKAEGSPELCLACTCHTGKIIYILAPSKDTGRFTSLGFSVAR